MPVFFTLIHLAQSEKKKKRSRTLQKNLYMLLQDQCNMSGSRVRHLKEETK